MAQSAATALGELGAYGGGALPTLDALIEPDVRETAAGVAYSAADGITKIDTAVTHLDEQRIAVTGGQPVGRQPSYTVQQLEEQKSFRRRAADRLAGLRSDGERSAAQAQRQLETGPSPVRYDAARELAESGRLLAQVTAALADAERHPVTSTPLHRVSAQGGPANGRQLLPEAALARELPELVAEEGQAPAIALRDSLQAVRQAEQRLAEIAREARGEPDVLERVVSSRNALERRRRETAAPLLAALDRVPVSTRPIVVEALGDTVKSEPVVAALRAAAENGATTSERGAALLALGRLQADAATDQMVAVMADERTDPVLRYQSARALQMLDGRADPATVVPALEAQLSARDPGLRYNAARALVAIKPDSVSPEAFDGLFGNPRIEAEIDRLVAEVAAGGDARAAALSRLGQIGPPRGVGRAGARLAAGPRRLERS